MVDFNTLYPKLQKLHTTLQRLKEAQKEKSLLIRTEVELDAAAGILDTVIEMENFLIDINKRLEASLLEIEDEEKEVEKKYPKETIMDLQNRVKSLLAQAKKASAELKKEESREDREFSRGFFH